VVEEPGCGERFVEKARREPGIDPEKGIAGSRE